MGNLSLSIMAIVFIAFMATITPESVLTFGTVAMLFATPVSVIISTVMARRDATKAAEKAETVAANAAGKAAEAARLLLDDNKRVADIAKNQGEKLDQIHVLVNSNMTASMQSELDYARANLVLLKRISTMDIASGKEPDAEAATVMGTTKARIAELESQLSDRLKNTKLAGGG